MIGDEAAGAAVKPVDPRITDDADSPVAQSPGEEQPRDNDVSGILGLKHHYEMMMM